MKTTQQQQSVKIVPEATSTRNSAQAHKMGAIDPIVMAKNPRKLKTALSIEAYHQQPYTLTENNSNNMMTNPNYSPTGSTNRRTSRSQLLSVSMDANCEESPNAMSDRCSNLGCESSPNNNSFQHKARKLLTLSPSGGSGGDGFGNGDGRGLLKPSVSTSCLFTEIENNNSSTSLNTNPSRASLTHEWKKLKTLNKCKECNLLVYFNGRECSFCGFIAHKKCLTVLVIKCSGQQVTTTSDDLISVNHLTTHGTGFAQRFKRGSQNATLERQLSANNNHIITNNTNSNNSHQASGSGSPKSKTPIRPIFGQPIEDADKHQVVDFIRRFIYEIDTRGLDSKGIYRVSSIKSKVDRLCTYYDQNLSSLIDLTSFHPNIIANALKMYLRQLPVPLLTSNKLYGQFIEIAKKYANSTIPQAQQPEPETTSSKADNNNSKGTSMKRQSLKPRKSLLHGITVTETLASTMMSCYNPMLIVELREVIEQLPPINQEVIALIMRHLRRVANMSYENQMSAKNLSIIFGPTLLSADENKSLAIVDNVHQARIIELMITWAEQIFPQYENYETKASIDLTPPEECYDNQLNADPRSQSMKVRDSSNHSSTCRCRDRKSRSSLGKALGGADCERLITHKQSDTRSELQELRRKFFTDTTPEQQQQQPSSPKLSAAINQQQQSLTNTKTHSLTCPRRPQNQNNGRVSNPQGSVPVIKVEPCYCNTLRKGC